MIDSNRALGKERNAVIEFQRVYEYTMYIYFKGAPCCDVMVTNYTLQYSTDGRTWKDYKEDCQTKVGVVNERFVGQSHGLFLLLLFNSKNFI